MLLYVSKLTRCRFYATPCHCLLYTSIQKEEVTNDEYLQLFLDAKRIEGCSERTIQYYSVTVDKMLQKVQTPVRKISTEEIRKYLVDYQKINDCSKVTVDNEMCIRDSDIGAVSGR